MKLIRWCRESSAWMMAKARHNGTKSRGMHLNGWIFKLIKAMKHCERWKARERNFLWDNWTWTVCNRVVGSAWLDRCENLAAKHFWLISYQTFDFPQTLACSTSCFQFYLELNSVVFFFDFFNPPDSRHSERKHKRRRKIVYLKQTGKLLANAWKLWKEKRKEENQWENRSTM